MVHGASYIDDYSIAIRKRNSPSLFGKNVIGMMQ